MNYIQVSNDFVSNGYMYDVRDTSITILAVMSNAGDYLRYTIVDSRFVPELRNFVWTAGMEGETKHLTASVTNANRQHLQRLNLFRGQDRISIHQFIPSLQSGQWITKMLVLAQPYDMRISSLAWDSDETRQRLDREYDEIIERNFM